MSQSHSCPSCNGDAFRVSETDSAQIEKASPFYVGAHPERDEEPEEEHDEHRNPHGHLHQPRRVDVADKRAELDAAGAGGLLVLLTNITN